jgi:protein tyrosine phosphatase (PTP) superfamily phosphohydrolase (DUF442 family)
VGPANLVGLAALAAACFVACAAKPDDVPARTPAAPAVPASSASAAPLAPTPRPARWASPLEKPGLPNLHRVNDGYYRGAQPTAEGMLELERLGVKTVVNLRAVTSDRDELGDAGLDYEHISFKAWHAEDEDVVRFLRIVTDAERKPVFVHCQHGADRTGMMTAIYRIVVQGWSKEDAIVEMTEGGFGYHSIWKNLVDYVWELDVERIAREAGITPAAAR